MWFCKHCGTRMKGPYCGNKWRDKDGNKVRCQEMFPCPCAEQFPPLDGMIFINDDGTGIPRLEQTLYEMYKQGGAKRPRAIQGPRPNGWDEALSTIGGRAAKIIEAGVSSGVVLPCGED